MDAQAFEQLVKKVTDELLCRLQSTKPTLLIMNMQCKADIKEQLSKKYQLTTCWDPTTVDIIFCGELTFPTMARLAALMPQEDETLYLEQLLAGKPLIILDEINWSDTRKATRYALYQKMQEVRATLERYGVVFMSVADIEAAKFPVHLSKKTPIQPQAKKVLAEVDVKELLSAGTTTIHLPKNTILTALATDYIRQHGMTVVTD
ncbi:hypothetical protein [Brochothrix thermosphacta]|uniref:Ethanolamine utilization protein n=1 Tax=Brochothrix thermosphacta TaxID=2756 RepID=A0A2X0QHU8_BROTH|nr:hypothetical protein [Brochothrix thermosphacta]SPP28166.1 hypothetical protein BTBSAS_20036 [Brochothrix thermosphacta]